MGKPTLSVIMSNYNHSHYIAGALEAILSQSYRPIEVIIIDDASTDNSVEVIQQFVERDPIVRLIRNERNMGNVYSVNKFLRLLQGDYIYTASADDQVLPGFFEKSMSLITQYPQAGICTADCIALIESTGERVEWKVSSFTKPCYLSPADLLKFMARNFHPPVTYSSTILKHSVFLEAGGFIAELKWSCDLFAVMVAAFRHGLCYFPEPLTMFRVREDAYSSGYYQWPDQREVIIAMMNLLETPAYKDVQPMFRKTSHLSHLPWQVLRVAASSPKYWRYISPTLLRYTFGTGIRKTVAKIVPLPTKTMYRCFRDWYEKKLNLSKYNHT